jgi:cytochrome c-type biogenesis protein CcmH
VKRRDFIRTLGIGAATLAVPSIARAQQGGNSMAEPMSDGGYREVRLAPKTGAAKSMTDEARDALEHRLHCQCGTCTLDVYTCRTTDFNCPVSPAMHRDVMALVEGGFGAQEIIDAFTNVYGARVLMAPPKSGFNWAGWIMPFVALGAGSAIVAGLISRWHRPAPRTDIAPVIATGDATPEEIARLNAALRRDG